MIRERIILLILSISLCVTFYYFSKDAVIRGTHIEYKVKTFTSILTGGLENHIKQVYPPWRGRLFSALAGNGFMKFAGVNKLTNKDEFAERCAAYNAVWLFGCFIVIMAFSKNPILFILGLFACSSYAWTPAGEFMLLPWDGPILFFWTLIFFLARPEYKKWMFLTMAIGVGFKESIILASIIPLFWNGPIKERIKNFIMAGIICVTVKLTLDFIVQNPIPFLSMQTHYDTICRTGQYWIIHRNLWSLNQPILNHVIFSAGGLIAAILLLPKKAIMFKTIALCYMLLIMFFGVITEARLWNELIPMFFIGLERSKI